MKVLIKKNIEEVYCCELNEMASRSVIAYAKIEECDLPTAVMEVCATDDAFWSCAKLMGRDEDNVDIEDLELTDKEVEMCAILLGDSDNIEQ